GLTSRLLEAPRRGPSGRLSGRSGRRLDPRHRSPKGRLRTGGAATDVSAQPAHTSRLVSRAMRVAGALLLGAIILLTTATPAAAAVVRQGETVTVGDLTILGTGRVGRDVFVQSGTLTVAGAIGRDLQAGGGMATLDGRVGHDVYAELASLRLTDRAVVDGSLFYTSEREATVAAGARIGGSLQRRPPERAQPQVPPGPTALFVDWLRGLVGLLLLGLLI